MYGLRTAAWLASLIYSTIPLFWLVAHTNARRWSGPGAAFRVLLPCWALFILIAGAVTWPWHEIVVFQNAPTILSGIIFLCLGLSIYLRSRTYFSWKQLSGAPEFEMGDLQQQRLVISGMHARVRHPIYLAHLLNLIGWTLIAGLQVQLWLVGFAASTGWLMIALEERELLSRFGEEYRKYQESVPSIIPNFK
jgi:protein-S-isoprenylcysteine O-methyltransferase Ste14